VNADAKNREVVNFGAPVPKPLKRWQTDFWVWRRLWPRSRLHGCYRRFPMPLFQYLRQAFTV